MVVGIAPSITFLKIGKTVLPYPELYKGAKINFKIEVKKYSRDFIELLHIAYRLQYSSPAALAICTGSNMYAIPTIHHNIYFIFNSFAKII